MLERPRRVRIRTAVVDRWVLRDVGRIDEERFERGLQWVLDGIAARYER